MNDILIVSMRISEAATLWVDYFSSYFQQISEQAHRKPFKIQYLWLEDCMETSAEDLKILLESTAGVKLQLVVLCPGFMEFISENSQKYQNFGNIFLSDRTLALLLGVSDDNMTDVHKKILPNYFQWQRLTVGQDQDENFTKEFLAQAMAILAKIWKQQSLISNNEKIGFSVSPKKIRSGQTSVTIILTQPLQKEDIVKVSIERNDEIFEVKSIKKRNPYTLKISIPNNFTEITAIVNILVEKNGNIVGSRPIKCESKLRELEQILRSTNNPVEFMCQSLGFNPATKEYLDSWLAQTFQQNLPTHFNLLINHSTPFAPLLHIHKHSHEEYPTLLHFAARFGFEKLVIQLLDCPGADIAYDIKNVCDMTPVEIAESNGHSQLATTLRGYMNMNEFSHMYTKLKEMTVDENCYLSPKCIEDLYKACPTPRPIIMETSPLSSPVQDCNSSGYMAMKTPNKINTLSEYFGVTLKEAEPNSTEEFKKKSLEIIDGNLKNEIVEDKFQRELLEIMNDFKNNVHSISQVEKLVEEWKNRNDVQKSFKEKEEQLHQMRLRYEEIQQEMKASMKKSTPFERVKKLFVRGKSREDKQEISHPILTSPSIIAIQSQRPISSLSISSSSSSGRMSTISGNSFGDSGTHSDNEDRKTILNSNDDDFKNHLDKAILELNYTPVPVPKPLKSNILLQKNILFETIEEKPVRPNTLPVKDEYYIQFPPSGLPISGTPENDLCTQEYMNINSHKSEENPEYINFKIITNR